MHPDEQFLRFALALGIGLLIGLERRWKAREEVAGMRAAGIRIFAAVGPPRPCVRRARQCARRCHARRRCRFPAWHRRRSVTTAGHAIPAAEGRNMLAKRALGAVGGRGAFALHTAAMTLVAFLAAGAGLWVAAALASMTES